MQPSDSLSAHRTRSNRLYNFDAIADANLGIDALDLPDLARVDDDAPGDEQPVHPFYD